MKMVVYQCEDCMTEFAVGAKAVEDADGIIWCPSCDRLTNNEIGETDVTWEGEDVSSS